MDSSTGILAFIFLSYSWSISHAHVGLTFPPARHLNLDFLDNIRTKAPCGMPKGKTKTLLQSGIPLNISWHLSYPHRGGYRLELLDRKGEFLLDLISRTSNSTDEYKTGDPTAQWHTVTIPDDLRCNDCSIRLLRQASEWANAYRFMSCADVRIVGRNDYSEDCMNHGTPVTGGCRCEKGFWGPRCQYEEECISDIDCGKGSCIDLGGTSLPQRQCFCPPGLHGERCSKKNLAELPTRASLDLSSYRKEVLSKAVTLYHKVVDGKEVEFVMEVDGTSYGAIGWRPGSFTKACKRWPYLADDDEEEAGTIKRGKREAIGRRRDYVPNETLLRPVDHQSFVERSKAAAPANKGNNVKNPQGNLISRNRPPKRQSSFPEPTQPEPEAEPGHHGSQAEPEGEPKPESSPAPIKSQAEPEPEFPSHPPSKSQAEPEPETKPESSPEPEAESEPPHSQPKPVAESSPEPKPEAESSPEPKPEAESSPEPEPESSPSENSAQLSDIPKSEPEVQSETEPSPESVKPEYVPTPKSESGTPESEPEAESEPQPESEPSTKPPKQNAFRNFDTSSNRSTWETRSTPYTPKGDFHAMDCTDIVLGSARGVYSRILDYYTRDRSTPRLDSFWGGSNSISSATGWETNGKTTLIFRKPLVASPPSPTDHSLNSGTMHVIWAVGQRPGAYVHSPSSGLERESPSVAAFYAEDEVKYHGHRDQRGVTFIDFT